MKISRNCKTADVHREGKKMVTIFFLFDKVVISHRYFLKREKQLLPTGIQKFVYKRSLKRFEEMLPKEGTFRHFFEASARAEFSILFS